MCKADLKVLHLADGLQLLRGSGSGEWCCGGRLSQECVVSYLQYLTYAYMASLYGVRAKFIAARISL